MSITSFKALLGLKPINTTSAASIAVGSSKRASLSRLFSALYLVTAGLVGLIFTNDFVSMPGLICNLFMIIPSVCSLPAKSGFGVMLISFNYSELRKCFF